jgi:hypothetical protein
VDLLRPRAIPALIAALALPCAAADCASLQGTYRYKSAGPAMDAKLSDLSMSRERSKLYRVESKGSGAGSLSGGGVIQRPRTTPLAETAALSVTAKDTRLKFMDAAGKVLAEMTINDTGRWLCKGGKLERAKERTAGLGDVVRTERVVETLERNAAGDLVLRESVVVLKPAPGAPKVTEARFPAVK